MQREASEGLGPNCRGTGNVRRVALSEGRVKTFVLSGKQKKVKKVGVTAGGTQMHTHGMDDGLEVGVDQRFFRGGQISVGMHQRSQAVRGLHTRYMLPTVAPGKGVMANPE